LLNVVQLLTAVRSGQDDPGRSARRLLALLLAVPILAGGLLLSPAQTARADQLSDALAQQQTLERKIASQKTRVAELTKLQASLSGQIASTRRSLSGVNADLVAVRGQVDQMIAQIAVVQAQYDQLVEQIQDLDAQVIQLRAEEALKVEELAAQKAQLADRIRNVYDVDRTSLLELVLSTDSFTDLLSEAGYYMDVAAQDRALAEGIQRDQAVLAALRETILVTRAETDQLRIEAADQKARLDGQLADLREAQAQLEKLEAETRRLLEAQRAAHAQLGQSKAEAERILSEASAAERALQKQIDELVAQQYRGGRIPSVYNGTFDWPMDGRITQEFGCTGFSWEPPLGGCAHFHRGIDIAAPMYTPIRAAGPGTVVFAGPNPYDAYPKAWIVIIVHSTQLRTWYGHVDNVTKPPTVRSGDVVRQGEVIAYNGMTGRTTGPHLHWMVEFEGDFVNPRLFL
jgi:murein DD-endopeptidase MepM/ murein hydrolase activator NlpD